MLPRHRLRRLAGREVTKGLLLGEGSNSARSITTYPREGPPVIEVVIRSRIGNAVLLVAGLIYSISGMTLLIYYVVSNWGANGLADYLLQLALALAVVGGAIFFRIGRRNPTDRP